MNNNGDSKATASLILGVLAIVCIFFGNASFIGIILAVIGLVLGRQAKEYGPSKKANIGVILCTISLIVTVLFFVMCVACVGLVTWGIFA